MINYHVWKLSVSEGCMNEVVGLTDRLYDLSHRCASNDLLIHSRVSESVDNDDNTYLTRWKCSNTNGYLSFVYSQVYRS